MQAIHGINLMMLFEGRQLIDGLTAPTLIGESEVLLLFVVVNY
jgi:hypothetical protein